MDYEQTIEHVENKTEIIPRPILSLGTFYIVRHV